MSVETKYRETPIGIVGVTHAEGTKCPRCWFWEKPEVKLGAGMESDSANPEFDELCLRCARVMHELIYDGFIEKIETEDKIEWKKTKKWEKLLHGNLEKNP